MLEGSQLFAGSKGRLYRLDPATGRILWENGLAGKGWGLISIAQADGNRSVMEEKRRRDEEAAAAASSTAATM